MEKKQFNWKERLKVYRSMRRLLKSGNLQVAMAEYDKFNPYVNWLERSRIQVAISCKLSAGVGFCWLSTRVYGAEYEIYAFLLRDSFPELWKVRPKDSALSSWWFVPWDRTSRIALLNTVIERMAGSKKPKK